MTLTFVILVIISTLIWTSQSFEIQTSDAEFLRKQELVFQLLWSTKETPNNHPEVFERVKNFKIEDVSAACDNQVSFLRFTSKFVQSANNTAVKISLL